MNLSTGDGAQQPAPPSSSELPPPAPSAWPATTHTLPPPPPPPAFDAELAAQPRRGPGAAPAPGRLTPGWRFVTALVWSLVFVALLAVSNVSRQLGLSTWWLGPLGQPRPFPVQMVPFVPSAAMVLVSVNNARFIPWIGFVSSAWLAVVGAFDLGTVPRLGIVELGIAAAAALASTASLSGRYRRPRPL